MTTTPMTNRMIAVQIGGGKQLHNIMWQGCDHGRMIKHAT